MSFVCIIILVYRNTIRVCFCVQLSVILSRGFFILFNEINLFYNQLTCSLFAVRFPLFQKKSSIFFSFLKFDLESWKASKILIKLLTKIFEDETKNGRLHKFSFLKVIIIISIIILGFVKNRYHIIDEMFKIIIRI